MLGVRWGGGDAVGLCVGSPLSAGGDPLLSYELGPAAGPSGENPRRTREGAVSVGLGLRAPGPG